MIPFKLSGNFWTVLVFALFIGSVVYLSQTQPTIAPVFTAAMLPFVIGIIGSIQRSEASVQQSAANNVKIAQLDTKVAQVDSKVDDNTEVTQTTGKAVNGQMREFKQALIDVAELKSQQAGVLAELVAARAELAVANARAGGITTGRGQAAESIAASDASRALTSGAHDDTPIVEAPVTVVAPKDRHE